MFFAGFARRWPDSFWTLSPNGSILSLGERGAWEKTTVTIGLIGCESAPIECPLDGCRVPSQGCSY